MRGPPETSFDPNASHELCASQGKGNLTTHSMSSDLYRPRSPGWGLLDCGYPSFPDTSAKCSWPRALTLPTMAMTPPLLPTPLE